VKLASLIDAVATKPVSNTISSLEAELCARGKGADCQGTAQSVDIYCPELDFAIMNMSMSFETRIAPT
jgi:hypothetical protein